MPDGFPRIDSVGLDGLLVRFGDRLDEAANRAALAFRAALEKQTPQGVEECSTSLVSAFVRFDPVAVAPEALTTALSQLLNTRDWYAEPLPDGRSFITIPTVYEEFYAPQLGEVAQLAGVSIDEAVTSISNSRVRVTAIGFAPGQPYLGALDPLWDIPRQSALTPQVPAGALVLAIRQLVLFTNAAPTGWRHVGQTAAPLFKLGAERPFLLRPGDEVQFVSVSAETFETMKAAGDGGVVREALT